MFDVKFLPAIGSLLLAVLAGCERGDSTEAISSTTTGTLLNGSEFVLQDGFDCDQALPGWRRATAITPDVIGPCSTGSSGSCADARYSYVSGTGWCRPR